MTTAGVTAPQNLTKPSFAVWHLHGSGLTSKVILGTMLPLEWLRNSSCSGESQPGVVGGKASS